MNIDLLLLLARILISVYFLIIGIRQLIRYPETVEYVASLGIPFPPMSAAGAMGVEVILGTCILLGIFVPFAAIILALHTLVTAFLGHAYWKAPEQARGDLFLHFYKNVNMAGGMLALAAAGAGHFAL
ncbi:Inner membrane protein YphA [Halomonadaceae bacterium LMG 33818]|uniref:DoxX family protein n=1 Tax=Cernens ardua TaxID=3402176 RepID=UPI003EDC0572